MGVPAWWHNLLARPAKILLHVGERKLLMAQLKKPVDPFGEVNVHTRPGGVLRVTATILMEPRREGTQTGIALDGSGSMAKLYGVEEESKGGGFWSNLFGGAPKKTSVNEVSPVAQK